MICSSAARSIRAGRASLTLLLLGGPSGLQAELGHQGREIRCWQRGSGRLGRHLNPGRRYRAGGEKGPEQLDRNGEDGGGVVLRGDLDHGLEVAELEGG